MAKLKIKKPLNRKKVLKLKQKPLTPEQYLGLIDEFYLDAKLIGLSRFDVKWGRWSYEMNREINMRVKAEDPESAKLKYVMVYWVLRSQLLELYRKKGILNSLNRKNIEDEAETIKEMVVSGSSDGLEPLSMEDLGALILRSNKEDA